MCMTELHDPVGAARHTALKLYDMHFMKHRLHGAAVVLLSAAVITTGAMPSANTTDSQWAILSLPTPALAPNGQLIATSCTSATACTAVGVAQDASGRDVALAERWNGAQWEGQPTPRASADVETFFAGVSCSSMTTCTAVGNTLNEANQHVALAERWNGHAWVVQPTPTPRDTVQSFLSATSCASPMVCVAVGYGVTAAGQKVTLAERWNGRAWQIQSSPNAADQSDSVLSAISCTSAVACTAVGKSTSSFSSTALIERWDGGSWQIQAAASPAGASGSTLSGVSCTSRTVCIAVGTFAAASTKSGGALAERWDGANWTVEPTPGSTLDVLSAVSCATNMSCSAVGQTGFSQSIVEQWNGASWERQSTSDAPGAHSTNLVGISCVDSASCTAVGYALYDSGDGTYLTFTEQSNADGWRISNSFNPLGATSHGLAAASCTSANTCMAVGFYFTAAGVQVPLAEQWNGVNWQIQAAAVPSGARASSFSGVSCATASDCTAVGSAADSAGKSEPLVEHWNGAAWRVDSAPGPVDAATSGFSAVSCSTTDDGRARGRRPTVCTAVGASVDSAGTVTSLIERWNGSRWDIQPSPNPDGAVFAELFGVSCATPRECTAVGFSIGNPFNFLTLAEAWDGTSWTIQPSPNPVGTDGPNGTFEGGVSCPMASACTAVGQFSPSPAPHPGVTLAERWNGSAWQVQNTPNPGPVEGADGTRNSPFAAVSCATVNSCTAVGTYDSGNASEGFLTLAEQWNGTRWSVQHSATPTGASVSGLVGVSCATPRSCIAVGQSSRFNAQTNSRGRPVALAERFSAGDD